MLQEGAAATEAAQHEEEMSSALAALQRQSEEEVRIEERLSQLQAEESVLVANREQRLAQYSERREQDHADALKREEELSQALKVLYSCFSVCSVPANTHFHWGIVLNSVLLHPILYRTQAQSQLGMWTLYTMCTLHSENRLIFRALTLQGQVSEEVERERRQWRRARELRAQAQRDKHLGIAQRVTNELIGLALLHVEYANRTGVPVPSKVKRE